VSTEGIPGNDPNGFFMIKKKIQMGKKIESSAEDYYDAICSEIGFGRKTAALRKAIKEFGRVRYLEGGTLMPKKIEVKKKKRRCDQEEPYVLKVTASNGNCVVLTADVVEFTDPWGRTWERK